MAGIEPTLPTATPAYKPVYMGGTRIDKLYLGDTSIPKAYLGNDIVFQREASNYFRITNNTNNYGTITLTKNNNAPTITLRTRRSDTGNWVDWGTISATTTFTLPENSYIEFDGSGNASLSNSSNQGWSFTCNVSHDVEGDITALISGNTLPDYVFNNLFSGDTQLANASGLTLPDNTSVECYKDMFKGCSNLETAPQLPATTLAQSCYEQMFSGCTSLDTAPAVPATTLATKCYSQMFKGCTNLTAAPELPATTLVSNSYYEMFYGCTSLNEIHCSATSISATFCTSNWVGNVAASGTFYCDPTMTSTWTTGNNGVPSGWTIQAYNNQ